MLLQRGSVLAMLVCCSFPQKEEATVLLGCFFSLQSNNVFLKSLPKGFVAPGLTCINISIFILKYQM